jgi:GGDEF domain-containing protein
MNSSFSAVYRRRIAHSTVVSSEHDRGFHAGATADTATQPSAIPHRRDESASHRDERHASATSSPPDVTGRQTPKTRQHFSFKASMSWIDARWRCVVLTTQRVASRLRSVGERAKNDRALAAIDRELGERDRGVGLEDLQREIDRAHRTGEKLVAAYVDVDGLKAVNAQHGHHAGDQLLQDVVEALRRDMRSYDLLIRLGGDEFLCVMPGLTTEQARHRFEHLKTEPSPGSTLRSLSFASANYATEKDRWGSATALIRTYLPLAARDERRAPASIGVFPPPSQIRDQDCVIGFSALHEFSCTRAHVDDGVIRSELDHPPVGAEERPSLEMIDREGFGGHRTKYETSVIL